MVIIPDGIRVILPKAALSVPSSRSLASLTSRASTGETCRKCFLCSSLHEMLALECSALPRLGAGEADVPLLLWRSSDRIYWSGGAGTQLGWARRTGRRQCCSEAMVSGAAVPADHWGATSR